MTAIEPRSQAPVAMTPPRPSAAPVLRALENVRPRPRQQSRQAIEVSSRPLSDIPRYKPEHVDIPLPWQPSPSLLMAILILVLPATAGFVTLSVLSPGLSLVAAIATPLIGLWVACYWFFRRSLHGQA